MYAPTANGTAAERRREQPQMTASSPKVATNSLNICAGPLRTCRDSDEQPARSNMTCADHDASERAGDLRDAVAGHVAPRQAALRRIRERDGRIEVRAGNRTERENQRDQRRARRERVREQRDAPIAGR